MASTLTDSQGLYDPHGGRGTCGVDSVIAAVERGVYVKIHSSNLRRLNSSMPMEPPFPGQRRAD